MTRFSGIPEREPQNSGGRRQPTAPVVRALGAGVIPVESPTTFSAFSAFSTSFTSSHVSFLDIALPSLVCVPLFGCRYLPYFGEEDDEVAFDPSAYERVQLLADDVQSLDNEVDEEV